MIRRNYCSIHFKAAAAREYFELALHAARQGESA
jgi:hypothetical protein